ncbi:Na(+)/H(+) exchange regulatory cofactor NHE-RF2 [Acipenser ruthenus]|uniref:Na(+)/H(+) exchange regulatory cofactor NHE-RF2 n=1 Tax=Acipenser ruthenus TaxID=7906 RepID=A0A444UF68_ACIRT|nr:Na(+)/H(+) exchange regulatory cofactor NHE-RF2 [Acipenser ruthenus]
MAKDLKPRLCCMSKGDNGYGFHLHGEKGKNGQFIRKVEANSPAEAAGMHAGDRVVEVNGVNVEKETHHQVVQRIKAVEKETRLLVVDKETDELLRGLRLTCTEEMAHSGVSVPGQAAVKQNGTAWKQQLALNSEAPKRMSRTHSSESRKKESRSQMKELHPRLCVLIRGESGYGFNLHSEKSKPGQYIRSVDTGSPADIAGLKPQDRLIEIKENVVHQDPFAESGLSLSPTAAEAKEKAHAKRAKKRAPQMDWNKKHEIFSNF